MGLFKTLKGLFMKTSKKNIVVYTMELSEVDLDIAIDNYPKVEKQILDYVERKEGLFPIGLDGFSILMTVELRVDGFMADRAELPKEAEVEMFIKEDIEPPPADTESKDVIMDPGTMMANLAKDFKPTNAEEG